MMSAMGAITSSLSEGTMEKLVRELAPLFDATYEEVRNVLIRYSKSALINEDLVARQKRLHARRVRCGTPHKLSILADALAPAVFVPSSVKDGTKPSLTYYDRIGSWPWDR